MARFVGIALLAAGIGSAVFLATQLRRFADADDVASPRTAAIPKDQQAPRRLTSIPDAKPAVSAQIDFKRDIQPIFAKHCYACHGPSQARSGLRLDLRDNALEGGDSGPAIVAGHSAQSLLVQYITGKNDAGLVMPPPDKAPPLSSTEIAALRSWIDHGANWPAETSEAETADIPATPGQSGTHAAKTKAAEHWAFQPVRNVKAPVNRDPWIDTPIDAFVLAKLQEHQLSPNPEASRTELIRRVTFDLLGLPPTPEQVQMFLNDKTDDAYERMVDRLLESAHYGERWARHWLDLARYADSDGFEEDQDRPFAYKYRDYVIGSFNDDKPYNEFLMEQIAGDELDAGNPDNLIALGFLRNGPTITNQHTDKNRADEVDDMVATTSAVCLGMTVGCARCHDHKYEPISQRDYYRMFAVFDNTEKIDQDEIMQVRDPVVSAHKTCVMIGGDCAKQGPEVLPGVPAVLDNGQAAFPTPKGTRGGSVGRRMALAKWIASPDNPLTARVIVNRLWMYHFGRGLVNTPSNFGVSGDAPTHPELLDYLAGELVRSGWKLKRLQKMIVMSATYRQSSTYNPMKAGVDPTDQWYSRFPLHRLEAEEIRDSILVASGDLHLRMFGPGFRPKIPDGIVAAGSKDKWPKVEQEGPDEWRRSIYIFVKRSVLVPMMEGFDCPASTQTCERRMTTTVSTQALVLLNDDFSNEQADHMAARIIRDVGDDVNRQVERAYWLALSRPPSEEQQRTAAAFVEQRYQSARKQMLEERQNLPSNRHDQLRRSALADLCHVLFNSNEFAYVN